MSGRGPATFAPERTDRVVIHVDMDCFYAACERLREPKLRGEPVVVGMGYEPGDDGGAVATASYEAREFGVESAQAITEALDRLPRRAAADPADPGAPDPEETGFYRPVDMSYYKSVSDDVETVLEEAVEGRGPEAGTDGVVRAVSIDEAYLDVTGVGWQRAEAVARELKHDIEREAGVAASVGVAPNMSTAKVASDFDKPDGLVVVEPGETREFLAPLDVRELHGVGPVTARHLREMGIETAEDLAAADPAELEAEFGARGREIHAHARGRDDRPVTPVGNPKSLSSESALSPTDDTERKRDLVGSLAEDVAKRAQAENALYKTVGIKVVEPPFDINTRERSLSGPVDDPELVESIALDLLREFHQATVRKLGVRVSNLDFSEADQVSLDGYTDTVANREDYDASKAGDSGAERFDRGGSLHGQTTLADFY